MRAGFTGIHLPPKAPLGMLLRDAAAAIGHGTDTVTCVELHVLSSHNFLPIG